MVSKISLACGETRFEADLLEAVKPDRLVLFAVGAGGNPERHRSLLETLAGQGCSVIAPYFERLVSPMPTSHDLLLRARRLRIAIDYFGDQTLPVVGVGASIGAATLLALAGAQMWMRAEECLAIPADTRLGRLVLITPPTGFFQAPKALSGVDVPVQIWAGTNDAVTPPAQAEFLRIELEGRVPLEMRLIEGAGHYTFMNTLPPGVADSFVHRDAFLNELTTEVCRFVLQK